MPCGVLCAMAYALEVTPSALLKPIAVSDVHDNGVAQVNTVVNVNMLPRRRRLARRTTVAATGQRL